MQVGVRSSQIISDVVRSIFDPYWRFSSPEKLNYRVSWTETYGTIEFNTCGVNWICEFSRDSLNRYVCFMDQQGWSVPSGRPHASWLRPVESYLKDMSITGLVSAWVMARRRPKQYRCKVDASTHLSSVCHMTWPDASMQRRTNFSAFFITCLSNDQRIL